MCTTQFFTSLSIQNPPSLPDFEPTVAYWHSWRVHIIVGSYKPTLVVVSRKSKKYTEKIGKKLISGETQCSRRTAT
jgi:hypothetical protein